MLGNHPHDVVGCGRPCTPTALAHRERAVVVHEEDGLVSLLVPQAHPHARALAEVLPGLRLVVRDDALPLLEHFPDGLAVSDADVLVRVPGHEVFVHASIVEHAVRLSALLEAHEIKWRILRVLLDQLSSRTSVAAILVEQLPPEQVVGQDPDLRVLLPGALVLPDTWQGLLPGVSLVASALREGDPLAFALLAHLQAELGGTATALPLQAC
mmetsp:Transcript_128198/g.356745  ORF Transcript_128198/g.356745 Transcript_128198/m.356745 type:complete len:212 (+) Transcript_128198:285-920(+)